MPQSAIFSIFDNAGARLAMTYNGLTMNNPSSPVNDRIEIKRLRPRIPTRFVADERQHSDGSEVQAAHKTSLMLEMTGRIMAPSRAKLYDACRNVSKRFDPALISINNPTVRGFLAFDGSAPTDDTVTHVDGLIEKRLYLRPMEPVFPVVMTGGNVRSQSTPAEAYFQVQFLARDPRVYRQLESQHVINELSETVDNSIADYPSWPTITLMVGATAPDTLTLTNVTSGLTPLTIDTSDLDDHQVVIDMEKHTITIEGIERPERYVSGDWFQILPGSNTVTISSITGLGTSDIDWRQAMAY